jgi:nicotinamide mononucleotide transporter
MPTRYFWPLALTATALLFCLLTNTDWLTVLTVISGVGCVSLIAIGKRLGYLVGLVSSVTYAWIAWENGLFGEVGLNILFYLPTGIIGYIMWSKYNTDGTVKMRRLTRRHQCWMVITALAATVLLGGILETIPSQNRPFVDAATNVLSIIATLLMMWRFAEQWWLYVTLNVLTVGLWLLRYSADGFAADSMIFLWLIYLINSVFGLVVWRKSSRQSLDMEY